MNDTIEERVRAAARAEAATMREVRPLTLPPASGEPSGARTRHARRLRGWIAPVTAAAAIIALAISLVAIRDIPNGRVVPPAAPAPAVAGMPRYYVALDGPTENNPAPAKVVVGDTFSGKALFTFGPFAGGGAVSVTAAADDRTFVVATGHHRAPAPPAPTAWYVIRLYPGSPASASLRALAISVPAGDFVEAMALSPDGTKLAMIGAEGSSAVLSIYSVATGAMLATWSSPITGNAIEWFGSPLWWTDDGRALAFGFIGQGHANGLGVWLLQANRQGHDLFADSRFAWSTQVQGTFDPNQERPLSCAGPAPSVQVTADGKTIVCGAWGVSRSPGNLPDGTCPSAPPWNTQGFLEYSTATGKLTRALYRLNTSCVPSEGPAQVLWTSPNGDSVIGFFDFNDPFPNPGHVIIRFGVFRDQKFTPLPVPPATAQGSIAW